MNIPKELENQLRSCPVNFQSADNLIKRARKDLTTAALIQHDDREAAYTLFYDCMLHSGLACMSVLGYSPNHHGKHKTVILFMEQVLGRKSIDLIEFYDRMRRKRHQFLYEPGLSDCTEKEIKDARKIAEEFLLKVVETIKAKHPQKELSF